jgi:hypothetical protein
MRARIADIIYHASQLSGIPIVEIVGRSRLKHKVQVRHAVCLIAREQRQGKEPAYSFPTIGRAMGKDHSTVIHGCRMGRDTARRDPVFATFVETLRQAAQTGKPFAEMNAAPIMVASVPAKPVKRPHVKAVSLAPGEMPDGGHKFHAGIAAGSAALLKALAA